jgi:predicted nucleic acid-binding protein
MNKYNIHLGESSIIALAEKKRVDYCITNEIKVRNAMKSEGYDVVGTLGIILKACRQNMI